jgi:hypothetical protein
MKIKRTPPQNWEFFNEHGPSYSTYGLIGFIGQLLSGMALAYAVQHLLLAELSGNQFAGLMIALAVLVGLFIELANRVLARRAIKPMVVKDAFAEDPTTQQRHQVLNRSYLLLLVVVALLSYFLSAVGSTYYAEDRQPPPPLVDTDSIKLAYANQGLLAQQTFAADTSLLKPLYQARLMAAQERFRSDSLALRKERSRYEGCAQKGNQWCKQQLTAYLAKIDRSRGRMADSLATIQQEQSLAFNRLLNQRQSTLNTFKTEEQGVLKEAQSSNNQTIKTSTAATKWQGLIFLLLTIAGQTIFYGMVYLQLQIEAGSEITQEVFPNEFWADPPLLSELGTTISWRAERGLRRLIRWIFKHPQDHPTDIPYLGLKVSEPAEIEDENTKHTKASCAVKDTPENWNLADIQQRLKQYKKRLGAQQQKALKQERETGQVSSRTQAAVENNARWVDHYTQLLRILHEEASSTNGVLK